MRGWQEGQLAFHGVALCTESCAVFDYYEFDYAFRVGGTDGCRSIYSMFTLCASSLPSSSLLSCSSVVEIVGGFHTCLHAGDCLSCQQTTLSKRVEASCGVTGSTLCLFCRFDCFWRVMKVVMKERVSFVPACEGVWCGQLYREQASLVLNGI